MQLGSIVQGRFRIAAVLGKGAMGVVYRAEQLDPDGGTLREVALKTIQASQLDDPALASSVGQRFLRELRVAAGLSSPHTVMVHDSGRTDEGELYFAMELVPGETLRDLLQRGGRLPAERAIRIACQICDALAEAHGGKPPIVHRDLKPANIFIQSRDGRDFAKVADFGIAKVVGGLEIGLTATGSSPGTPLYMSPEQWRGKTDVDGRSDLYALGVILHEMLSGAPPFSGPAHAVMHDHLNEPPPELPAEIPPALRSIVRQLMEKEPAARPESADAVRRALEGISSGATGDASRPRSLAGSAVTQIHAPPPGAGSIGKSSSSAGGTKGATGPVDSKVPLPLPDKPSIVVLPFDNMSGDKEQEYFADGITEDIITDISQVSGLFVIARNSAFTYKGKAVNVGQVGRELGVKHVLEGSVRKAGNRIRITAQLIDAASGGHLWAARYDRDLDDIFAVQDEVTREIVNVLRVKLTGEEKARIAARPTDNLEAYEIFLRGRDLFWRFGPATNLEARRLFADAIALDERFADAVAMHGMTYVLDYANRWSDLGQVALDNATDLSARAIEIDESRPFPHFARSVVHLWSREFDEALVEDDRCRELDPNFPYNWSHRGSILLWMGRSAEAIEFLNQAIRRDPLTPDLYLHFLGQCHFDLGEYEEAERMLRRRITRQPETDVSRVLLAAALGHLGRHEEARREWARARAINPRYSLAHKRAILPYRDPAMVDRMAEGLAKAGIDVEQGGE